MRKRSRKAKPRKLKSQSRKPKVATKRPKKRRMVNEAPVRDANQAAYDLVRHVEALGATPDGKNPAAVALGRRGGLIGGHARAEKLSDEELSASARKAARARWDKVETKQ